MAELSLLSWNICGLNSPNKRACCLDYLHRKHIDIAFIQETYLKTSTITKFANKYYYVAVASLADSKTKGSLIFLRRKPSLNILGSVGIMDGKVAILKTVETVEIR